MLANQDAAIASAAITFSNLWEKESIRYRMEAREEYNRRAKTEALKKQALEEELEKEKARAKQEKNRADKAERRAMDAEAKVNDAENRANDAEARAKEAEKRLEAIMAMHGISSPQMR